MKIISTIAAAIVVAYLVRYLHDTVNAIGFAVLAAIVAWFIAGEYERLQFKLWDTESKLKDLKKFHDSVLMNELILGEQLYTANALNLPQQRFGITQLLLDSIKR